jgi:hypothetical protein
MAITEGHAIDVLGGSPPVSARIDAASGDVTGTSATLDDANGAVAAGTRSYILGGDTSGRIVGTIWVIGAGRRSG